MNPWLIIIIGGVFETCWAITMKMSEGFTNIIWTLITLGFMACSIWLLNKGMNSGNIPIGSGYSVWVGIGAVGSIILGIIIYKEPLTLLRMIFATVIIIGIIGVEMSHKSVISENETAKKQ